jgi:hypothetical protein
MRESPERDGGPGEQRQMGKSIRPQDIQFQLQRQMGKSIRPQDIQFQLETRAHVPARRECAAAALPCDCKEVTQQIGGYKTGCSTPDRSSEGVERHFCY